MSITEARLDRVANVAIPNKHALFKDWSLTWICLWKILDQDADNHSQCLWKTVISLEFLAGLLGNPSAFSLYKVCCGSETYVSCNVQRQGQASRCQLLTVISMHTLPSSCCNTLHTPETRAWSSLSAQCEQLVHFTSAFSKSLVLLKAMCTAEMLQHASFHWRSSTHLV